MLRSTTLFASAFVVLVSACQPIAPPSDDEVVAESPAAPAPAPAAPKTGWEPQKVIYTASPESLVKTDDVVSAAQNGDAPNILVIWGDDIGQSNISAYTMGLMGYRTPNIDRVAR